jgi:hypothetical protein
LEDNFQYAEKEAIMVDERNDTDRKKDEPATQPVPETNTGTEESPEAEKEKEPQIPIKQVPMDGICGGY